MAVPKGTGLTRKQFNYNSWCDGGPAQGWWGSSGGGSLLECNEADNSPYDAPGALYYGINTYNPSENSAFDQDMGMGNGNSNGFYEAVDAVANQIESDNVWYSCVCTQENGQWVSTGSLQYSWDNKYNGYSDCFAKNCDGRSDAREG